MDPRLRRRAREPLAAGAKADVHALARTFEHEHELWRARARLCLDAGDLQGAHELLEALRRTGDASPATAILTALWLFASKHQSRALEALDAVQRDAEQAGDTALAAATSALRASLA